MIERKNIFNYGEVGTRLNGIRESEIYLQSAREIENFYITESGTLKVGKEYAVEVLDLTEDILRVINIKY